LDAPARCIKYSSAGNVHFMYRESFKAANRAKSAECTDAANPDFFPHNEPCCTAQPLSASHPLRQPIAPQNLHQNTPQPAQPRRLLVSLFAPREDEPTPTPAQHYLRAALGAIGRSLAARRRMEAGEFAAI
jgi:hypothetical protein